MTTRQPQLIVVDIGRTLGKFTGPSVKEILIDLCPWGHVNPAGVIARVHSILHVSPELSDEVIERVCDALLIDRDAWPCPWPPGGFRPFPGTAHALAALTEIAPIVALSNLSVTGKDRITAVERHLGRYLTDIYTSFTLRGRKPERWLWRHIANVHGTTTEDMLHCGNRWIEDVLGAAFAGAWAIWIPHDPVPPHHVAPPHVQNRIATAPRLAAVADLVLSEPIA